MSSPSTKENLKGLDKAEYLGTTIRTQLDTVSPELDDIYGVLQSDDQGGDAPAPFDWYQAQSQNADLIDHGVEDSKQTSAAHRVAKIRVSEASRGRHNQFKVIRSHYRSMQLLFTGSCGPESLKLVGLDVPLVASILGAREQYDLILQEIKNPALPAKLAGLAKSVVGGALPNLAALVQDMEREILAFEKAYAAWTQAKKVRDQAYAAKKAAAARLNRIVVNVARMQEGCYRLAGFDDLADRMRLTIPKLKAKKQKEETPPAADPTTDGEATTP